VQRELVWVCVCEALGHGDAGSLLTVGVGTRGLAFPTTTRDEPVRLALRRRRPGVGGAGAGVQSSGGGAGNGLPR
jgi:hypothetical protein